MTQFNWLLKQFADEVKPLNEKKSSIKSMNKTGGKNLLPQKKHKTMRNNG